MHAAWFEDFGPASDVLKVGEFDTPVAGPSEVLVRLHTSGVNPSDVKKRAGSFPNLLDDGPVIPNSDGAGVVEAVLGRPGDATEPREKRDEFSKCQLRIESEDLVVAPGASVESGLVEVLPRVGGSEEHLITQEATVQSEAPIVIGAARYRVRLRGPRVVL